MAIIKCPKCGKQISSQAFTCPHCNITLRDAKNTHKATKQDNQVNSEYTNSVQKKENKGISRGCGCFLFVFAMFLGAALFAVGTYAYEKYKENEQAYKQAILKELAIRIAEGEKANEARLKDAQNDSVLWQLTLKLKTIESAQNYIDTYPEGIFINEAYMLLEELQRRHVDEKEQKSIQEIVEAELVRYEKKKSKTKDKGVVSMHYSIDNQLNIYKKYVRRDSFVYSVEGIVNEIINHTDSNKSHVSTMTLKMILNKEKNLVESSLDK